MSSTSFVQRAKKSIYRRTRYHWLTERLQYQIRRDPQLKLAALDLELMVKPGDVIIDCGANIGSVTSLFARSGAIVYAFEPNPLSFTILSRRFRAMPTVHCFNQGVFDRQCKLTLGTPSPHGQWDALDTTISSSVMPGSAPSSDYTLQETEIECISLSDFIQSLHRQVRLLKLDIEGSEIPVLNQLLDTGTINFVDLTVVETHERQMPHLLDATAALRDRIKKKDSKKKFASIGIKKPDAQ